MVEVQNRRLIYGRRLYGRRGGHRLPPRQARLVRELLPRLRPDLILQQPCAWFQKPVDKIFLEIGFGGGEHLAARAREAPAHGFIGCEPFTNGIAKLLLAISEQQLNNIVIHDDDARDLLAVLPDTSLAGGFLLYPDPWPKTRHHKRRFVNQENLGALFRVLAPGAVLMVASDIADYLDWTLIHIRQHGGFDWRGDRLADWDDTPAKWPGTRYEAKALKAGRCPSYLRFVRRTSLHPGTL